MRNLQGPRRMLQEESLKEFIGGGAFGVNNWPPLPARLTVDDADSPVTQGIPKSFVSPTNEWYAWRPSPRLGPNIHVLLTLDPASVGAQGDFPLAWVQSIGRGRSYYNALGHFPGTWNDARFQLQIAAAIRWTAGR